MRSISTGRTTGASESGDSTLGSRGSRAAPRAGDGACLRRRRTFRSSAACAVVAFACITSPPARAMRLAHRSLAEGVIVLGQGAIPAERTAAEELATYLGRVTGATFEITIDDPAEPRPSRALFVGATGAAGDAGIRIESLGPEEWVLRTVGDGLILCGGRPRGTLYAVYRFLEDDVGVRWWSQHEEFVPRAPTLSIPTLDRRGEPAFAYRDVNLLDGPVPFCARNRLDGRETRLPWAWGGHVGFATPWFVHSFFYLVPPERYFGDHPEYFSERAGFRWGGRSQLCLTQPAVARVIADELVATAERARDASLRSGVPAPRLYDVSHNDWGGWCRCDDCLAAKLREGSDAGALLEVVNKAAEAVARVDPQARVTTLAYTFTFLPPLHVKPRGNVTVVLTGWGKRDFAVPVGDPRNAFFRDVLTRWSEISPHLWVWDYTFSMGATDLGLPFPTYRNYAEDLRLYRKLGVEGMTVQTSWEVPGDFRDLNVWLLAKLMEDPDRDERALREDFIGGFYGAAAKEIRRYLALLDRATRHPPPLGAEVTASAYGFLDASFLEKAQAIFDAAERSAGGDPVVSRRVRHARVSLDYATLVRWHEIVVAREFSGKRGKRGGLDRAAVLARYEKTCREQIDFRLPPSAREREWSRIEAMREDPRP